MQQFSVVHVVVPAHQEQQSIGACLDALERCAAHTPVPVTVTVVTDSCTDRTAELTAGHAELVRVDARSVGAARAAGLRRHLDPAAPVDGVWLATTDADYTVPPEWLSSHLERAAAGADVVAGQVRVADWTSRSAGLRAAYEQRYDDPSADAAAHVHGANLGFSAAAYRRLGGFAPLRCHEDVDLVARARAAGLRVVHCADAPVATSAREHSRAPGGFAGHLRTLDAALTDSTLTDPRLTDTEEGTPV